jgi:hypothetical protein
MPDVLACQDSTIPGQEASGMVSDPRPPSGDPLAAEIAAHRPYTAVTFSGGQGSHQLRCRKCGDEWPCLVRRLADELDALLAAGNAMAESIGLLRAFIASVFHGEPDPAVDGLTNVDVLHRLEAARASWAALAPADGDGAE